ncbi:MAG: hypothetical protein KDD47_12710, partial [Acidobacteria bacterium]|nr:hypothetical protein [Acidobacteriota bacterium]
MSLLSCSQEEPKVPTTREELIALLGPNYRPTHGRLAGFGYAPCTLEPAAPNTDSENLVPNVRCSTLDDLPDEVHNLIRRAHARVHPKDDSVYRGDGHGVPEPEDPHFAGLVELVAGGKEHLSTAIRSLEKALGRKAEEAQVYSDLAVAYLQKARQLETKEDLLEALEAIEKALELVPDEPTFQVNRIFMLDELGLYLTERKAIQAYLTSNSDHTWANELDAGSGPTPSTRAAPQKRIRGGGIPSKRGTPSGVPLDPFRMVATLHEKLLPQAASDLRRGESPPPELLNEIEQAGSDLRTKLSDRLSDEVSRELLEAAGSITSPRRPGLLEGYRWFSFGLDSAKKSDFVAAARYYSLAKARFDRVNSPAVLLALYQRALSYYYQNEYRAAHKDLLLLSQEPDLSPYLSANSLRLQGLILAINAHYPAASTALSKSLALCKQLGDDVQRAQVLSQIAEIQWQLGRRRLALRTITSLLPQSIDASILHFKLLTHYVIRTPEAVPPRARRVFMDEALATAKSSENDLLLISAHRFRAESSLATQDLEKAKTEIRIARELIARVASDSLRKVLMADLLRTEGSVLCLPNPAASSNSFQHARTLYEQTSYQADLGQLLLDQTHCLIASGEYEQATDVLFEAVSVAEETAREHYDEALGTPALPVLRDGLGEMALLQGVYLSRPELAFEYAERRRALLNRRILDPGEFRSLPGRLSRLLPERTSLLVMTPFHEQILLWLVDHRGLQQEIAPLSEALLIKQLADLSAALTSGSEDDVLEEKLTNLFSSLITPVLPELETAERLIVVADGSLAAIPFGGLWDRSSGEFLGSKFSIARALTCSGLVRRLESTDIGAPRPAASILAV